MLRMGIFLALALSACATDAADTNAAAASNDCFRSAQITGFSVIDRSHVGISVGASGRYVFTTMWNTYDLDWTHAIAIRSATGLICTGSGLGVDVIGGEPRRSYPVVSIERAPEEPAVQGS